MAQGGVRGLGIESWMGLLAPVRTPPEIRGRLRQETRIAAAELKQQFETGGGALMQLPVAETDKFIKSEFDLWTKVIRDAGIRLDSLSWFPPALSRSPTVRTFLRRL